MSVALNLSKKLEWMSRRLRWIDEVAAIREWVAVMTAINKLMKEAAKDTETYKDCWRPYQAEEQIQKCHQNAHIEELWKCSTERRSVSNGLGTSMSIAVTERVVSQNSSQPVVTEYDGNKSPQCPNGTNIRKRMNVEDTELHAEVKELIELCTTMNVAKKKWEELNSKMNEEEKKWWEVLKQQFEEDEHAGKYESEETVQRYVNDLIGKVELVFAQKLSRIPRARRSRLWKVLNQGARLLLLQKNLLKHP